jgi:hypothetical protein
MGQRLPVRGQRTEQMTTGAADGWRARVERVPRQRGGGLLLGLVWRPQGVSHCVGMAVGACSVRPEINEGPACRLCMVGF